MGDPNGPDTIYLVRAPDVLTAVQLVARNTPESSHQKQRIPIADVVHEIGIDSSSGTEDLPAILRGPYSQHAYNYGWKAWQRRWKGGCYTEEWEEKVD
jgi:hypothetical protein